MSDQSEYIVFKRTDVEWGTMDTSPVVGDYKPIDIGIVIRSAEVKDAKVIVGQDERFAHAMASLTKLSGAMGQYRSNLIDQGIASPVADAMVQQAQTMLMTVATGQGIASTIQGLGAGRAAPNRAARRASGGASGGKRTK